MIHNTYLYLKNGVFNMKKGIIVSLYDDINFGNKLQNYAVYKLIHDRKIDVMNIKNNRHLNYKNNSIIKSYIKFCLSKLKYFITKRSMYGLKYYSLRKENFKSFSKQIKTSKHYFSYKNLSEYDNNDYLFVGSDQVWNPYMALDDLTLFDGFNHGEKISMSASFGVSSIDNENDKKRIKEAFKKFKAISVREDDGKKIVDSLSIDKKCDVLIDPTMAIDKEEWLKQVKSPKYLPKKKYILLAFLGKIDEKLYNEITDLASRNNYEIVDLYKKNSYWTSCGPSEFLYLEKNAELICTDSFHSSVFGIIFNVPILVTGRNGTKENMNSRIETLLNKFKLESRKYKGEICKDVFEKNYAEANKIIEKEKDKYNNYLDNVLEVEGE